MYFTDYLKMEPTILLSIINMKLRNEFNGDLKELSKTYDLNSQQLCEKLALIGFGYNERNGQFMPRNLT